MHVKRKASTHTDLPRGKPELRAENTNHASFGGGTEDDLDRMSLRDPEEPSEGPLRLDDLNYSTERLTLPEGNYNTYADDESSSLDEDVSLRPEALDAHYPEVSQGDIVDTLPVPGANGADDRLRQTGEHGARHDLAILDVINDLLAGLAPSEAAAIEITVKNGLVILDGNVDEADTPHRIEQAIEAIPAVEEVRNQLAVRGEREPSRWSDK